MPRFSALLNSRRIDCGQTMPLVVFMIVVLIVFVGLGIDLGFAYLTRASMSKAVDAACLMGVRNISLLGTNAARTLALSTFDMNYTGSKVAGRQVAAPIRTATFSTDVRTNTLLSMDASVRINTYFVRVLPAWKTFGVAVNGQATRSKLVMAMVLDRSGSMSGNSGWSQLPIAVDSFINYFDDQRDKVGMSSFASHARLDVPIGQPWKTTVSNAVLRSQSAYAGGTFAAGGMSYGYSELERVVPGPVEGTFKVCVFFTDGLANIIQQSLNCPPLTLRNFGGTDSGTTVYFFDPANGNQLCSTSGGTPSCCAGVNRFTSAIDGTLKSFTRANVSADARFQTIALADAMRAQGTTVFAIGLGAPDLDFLRQVANDPASSTFDPNEPVGEADVAYTAADLKPLFEKIAARILLRLTQ